MSGRIFSFHFPLWCCCFPHPYSSFFYSWPSPLRLWPGEGSLGSRSWVSVGTFHAALMPLLSPGSWWSFGGFFLKKSHAPFFHRTIFASFAYFHFRTKPKAEQAWSMVKVAWWRFCERGGGNMMFSLTTMSPAVRHGAVYTHHISGLFSPCACLTWLVRLCVCVCACVLLDVSTGKHNSVNYYRITSIFIAFFA